MEGTTLLTAFRALHNLTLASSPSILIYYCFHELLTPGAKGPTDFIPAVKGLRAGVHRGLVANQVHMAKPPGKEPLRLHWATRVEAERLLGSGAQLAAW